LQLVHQSTKHKNNKKENIAMYKLKVGKNKYKLISKDTAKVKAFNSLTVALALYGIYSIIIK